MGLRPESLEPGQRISPVPVAQSSHGATLGAALPGRYQMLLFERGHWCTACRRHLALIAEEYSEFTTRKIDALAVTHESEDAILDRIYPFPVFADPELALATQFDLVGIDEFGARTIRPAVIVLRDTRDIVFSYVGDDSRDRPTIPALLLALDNVT